ncbi:MAG: hypothetical protein RL065_710 [Bacteroidota bacterium]|jgi:3-oxoacyl-[acyl-carrier-protein] synthase-3
MDAYLKAISYYLPEQVLTNEDINKSFPEWSIDKISSKTGIYQRHISAEDEFTSDMAVKVALQLFHEHSIKASDIDFVLLCTQSPDYFLPTTACILQDRLGIPTSAGALDYNLGCSGYVYGLALAKGLICGGMAKNILLITSETYTKFIHPKDKSNRTIFGDAASASLITAEPTNFKINEFVFGTDGKGAENLIVKYGATKYPHTKNTSNDNTDEFGNVFNHSNLYMNGAEIFNFTLGAVPKLVEQTLQKNNAALTDIDLFIFHQANQYMLNHLRKKLAIPEDKFYIYMKNCGNTVSATIPIALYHASNDLNMQPGQKILLAGFGVGYSWAGTTLSKI